MLDVTALILAGGEGTRLRPALPDIPKVLAPVNGRPFLSYLMDQLQAAGIREVVLCTGYRADRVFEAFGTRYEELEVRYSAEPRPLGTGGALRLAIERLDSDRFLVLNGDSHVHSCLAEFSRWHLGREPMFAGSILLARAADTARFGSVEVGPAGEIRSFREKWRRAGAGWINAGVYLLRRSLLESIDPDRPVSLEGEMFPRWIPRGLGGYATHAPFLDIGTPESYASAEGFLAGLRAIRRTTGIPPASY